MLFMWWTRETAVIPAVLAGLLLGVKAPGAQLIVSVTFIAILMTIRIQARTTEWLGRRLGLLETRTRSQLSSAATSTRDKARRDANLAIAKA
jgi:cell volume regulation protein A